ncbi:MULTISPECIES: beta-galactosidase GalA [unclassified Roseateles]|uniref:beta-galactosidase GalA n=1 Tax=unclassified Roseateles TaxID=2626991 RepID=UPI0006F708A4|nr:MULTISPECIES: beta-galactosidase GalA [unclassified Roseateles]KQW50825.1 beta-galactosidase [Pelomonas sp. Root405]KRA70815.1 beta-galactosidase [Pelomonas sp. Root662]
MTRLFRFTWFLIWVLAIAGGPASADGARQRTRIDDGWRFALGHAQDPAQDFSHSTRAFFFAKAGFGDGPAGADFDDRTWRRLHLPHDWAVELPFDARGSSAHGSKAIGRAFPENSVGWYRRELNIPAAAQGKRIALEFDGVFRDSVVWVNGHYLHREASGYSSFRVDISDYLNYGGRNVVAMRVDATTQEGWWYEGAGIYRHVWLTQTEPLRVGHWGTFVRAAVKGNVADVAVDTTVRNEGKAATSFSLEHELRDPAGRVVARASVPARRVGVDTSIDVAATLRVTAPQLWSLETPQLYKLTTHVRQAGRVVDSYDTPFGIRTIRFDANAGFFLNGRHVKLHGVNNHQDHAGIGVALSDGMHEARLKMLKVMGVNAIRSAHHPATPELLDACDRLGILVIDEHRMMGTAPQIRDEMERLVRRGRNHPSIILWSVGNEEWAIENSAVGTRLAREMQAVVRRMDPTRPVTLAASSSGGPEGTAVGSEVLGFNYKAQHDIDAMHKRFPERATVVTEEGLTYATRGVYTDDPARVHIAAYDKRSGGASTASIEEAWRYNAERPFIAGVFFWTGFDYRGETTPFGWPAVSSQFGMMDTTGLLKDSGHYLRTAWTTAPTVHLLPHWNWPGRDGQPIDVRVYANTDEVELLLNGQSLGRKPLARYAHLQWRVPYAPGSLVARGYQAGKLVATETVATTGNGSAVRLTADRTRIRADGDDVAVVRISVVDREGRVVPTAGHRIGFEASGPARLIGMGNGDPGSHEADKPAEFHRYAAVNGWRQKAVAKPEDAAALLTDTGSAAWRDPFAWLPADKQPADGAWNVVQASFARPAAASGRAALFVGDITPGQQVYLNGKAMTPRREDSMGVIDLDPAHLSDSNTLTLVFATPAGGTRKLFDDAQGGRRWLTLRTTTAAAPWQRSVFNGHAQVILQSTGSPGRATLRATGDGLNAADLVIDLD